MLVVIDVDVHVENVDPLLFAPLLYSARGVKKK